MDRDEILKKAKNEKPNKDEMAERVKKLSFRHIELIIMIPLGAFAFIKLLNHESIEDFWAIVFGIEAFPAIYLGIKEKRWGMLLAGIVMLAITLFSAMQFIKSMSAVA